MSSPQNLSQTQLDEVRAQVRGLLDKTGSFQHMPAEKRARIANGLVKVVSFLADPKGAPDVAEALAETRGPNAEQGGDPTQQLQTRLAKKPDLVQKEFSAPAAQAGGEAFKSYIDAVNFPQFVSGLIQGVFQSIVDASIRQMEAYGKLLEAVVKSVEQYAQDHVTPNQARDFLANKYPDALKLDLGGGAPRLSMKSDEAAESIQSDFKLDGSLDLSDEEGEQKLVEAAQLQMARMRQQQLATMVVMGINRIVVTDGLINAKVIIDVKTKDKAERKATASSFDEKKDHNEAGDGGGWFSSGSSSSTSDHDVIVQSATSDASSSDVQTKANLTGEVRVNFKSETFPLEKLASSGQLATVQERAAR